MLSLFLSRWHLPLLCLLLSTGLANGQDATPPSSAPSSPLASENLDFEQGLDDGSPFPKMWRGGGGGYEVSLDSTVCHAGRCSGKIARKVGEEGSFGVLNMQLPAQAKLAGQKIRVRGFLKFEGVTGFAGLWLRGDRGAGQQPAFYNMQDKNLRGSSDWKEYSFEMEMPQDVGRVNLGAMLVGEGTLWVDDIKLELLGSSIAPAAKAPSQADTRQMVLEAKASADAWLALIDSSKYQESWEKAASFLKNAVSSEKWAAEIPTVRNPLGKIVMRNLKQAQYMNAIPGAPDGKYVLVKYETDFESKSGAEESITMMFCPDGEWRAAGYFIR